jgi:hypothetical protein
MQAPRYDRMSAWGICAFFIGPMGLAPPRIAMPGLKFVKKRGGLA